MRKRLIDTYTIMSVIDRDERKYIFGKDIVIIFLKMYDCIFADKMKMLYNLTIA